MDRKTTRTLLGLGAALWMGFSASAAHAATYVIDQEHSSVAFKIRHLVSKTKGQFGKFDVTIDFDPEKPLKGKVTAVIDTASIDTNSQKRDDHLRSKDFFHVEKFPKMKFESTKVTKFDGKRGELLGKLTLHGVTKPVVLDVEFGGTTKDPWGNEKIGFTGTTTINRRDFGMTWNLEDKDGGVVLGEEVEISLEIEANKKQK